MEEALKEYAETAVAIAVDAGARYCDARAEEMAAESVVIEDGEIEHADLRRDSGIGIRVLGSRRWGFVAVASPRSRAQIRSAALAAVRNAGATDTEGGIVLDDIPITYDNVTLKPRIIPDVEELARIGLDCDKRMRRGRVVRSNMALSYRTVSKHFTSSHGSQISQTRTETVAHLEATARESGLVESVDLTEGGTGGVESIVSDADVLTAAETVASKSDALLDTRPAREEAATVVMNPDFVALLTHEILGHPSEADRVMGREMAWAGGAWWAGMIGQSVGSEHLNVFDDPSIPGNLGHYSYDDEGTHAGRTDMIVDGILRGHLQSMETAGALGSKPTANMRASSYRFMPLIRMACTCIGPGDWSPEEIIRDTRDGYLISNMKIPSIDMRRHNWKISCQWAHRIVNGEVTELLRDVIVGGTASEFFKSIDACGDDFKVRPITNCGKGDPMQSMAMGNGGPTIRGSAMVGSAAS